MCAYVATTFSHHFAKLHLSKLSSAEIFNHVLTYASTNMCHACIATQCNLLYPNPLRPGVVQNSKIYVHNSEADI